MRKAYLKYVLWAACLLVLAWVVRLLTGACCFWELQDDEGIYSCLDNEIGGTIPNWTEEEYKDHIRALFAGELAEPVKDAADVAVADGSFLPMQSALIDKEKYYIPEVLAGETSQDKMRRAKLYYITCISFMGAGNYRYFLNAMLERKDSLPPVEGDLEIYRAAMAMYPEMNGTTLGAPMDFWAEMGQGKYPIYRLLAIRGASSSILPQYSKFAVLKSKSVDPRVQYWSAEQKIQFYRTFLDEADPNLLKSVYRALEQSPHPESLAILEEQLENPIVVGDERLKKMLQRIIDWVKGELSGDIYKVSMATTPEDSEYFDFVDILRKWQAEQSSPADVLEQAVPEAAQATESR